MSFGCFISEGSFALTPIVHTIYTHIVTFKVMIDKSGCTIKHEFRGRGTVNCELERVDVLRLFYFCTIKHKFGSCGTGNYELERVATVMVDLILNFEVEH